MSYDKPAMPVRHAQMFEILRQTHRADLNQNRSGFVFGETDEEADAIQFRALAMKSLVPSFEGPAARD